MISTYSDKNCRRRILKNCGQTDGTTERQTDTLKKVKAVLSS